MGGETKWKGLLVSNKPQTIYDMANYILSEAAKRTKEDNFDDAAAIYGNIIDLLPAMAPSLVQRGRCHWEMHRWEEALKDFELAVRIDPNDQNAAWTLGLLYLQLNRFVDGWKYYERRWESNSFKSIPLNTMKKRYDLSKGGRVLVWPEQGLGDQIIYASLLEVLAAEGVQVTAMVDPRLVDPLSRGLNYTGIDFMPYNPNTDVPHDYHIPMASLGQLFISDLHDISDVASTNYIKADPTRMNKLAEILEINEDDKLIGLSWSSHAQIVGAHKSCKLEDLEPVLEWGKRNGYRFISLQYGNTAIHPDIIDPFCLNMILDIDGVCALVARCEFLVSVSNVNVHYAGAMGIPVYLLDANKLWYWNNRMGKRSFWYPSVSVYARDHMLAPWDRQIQNIIQDLEEYYGE